MSTILASASLAAAATTTTSVFPYNSESVITATITNGATPPNQQAKVRLELSTDNSTWTIVADRFAGAVPSATYYQVFELANYAGNNESSYAAGPSAYAAWQYYRLVFYNNDSQAVTIAAADGDPNDQAVVTLTGQANVNSGCQGNWTPSWPGPTLITNLVVYVTNNSTGASNMFAGPGNASNSNSALLINGAQLNAAAGTAIFSGANNSKVGAILNANGSLTFTVNADASGLVAKAYITYNKL